MANDAHLKILKEGVRHWNNWKRENPAIRPNLAESNLIGARLSEANLLGANLLRANLYGAILDGAILSGANLSGADLSNAKLSGANLSDANLSDANLSDANLSDANLSGATLDGANLPDADLSGVNLSGANLYGAKLSGADLSSAKLSRANFYGTNLYGTNLSGADLERIDLTDSKMYRTIFGNVDLSEAGGLESVIHAGPSTIGIDSIFRSKGKIPEIFLRRAGVPEGFIIYMKSLAANPIEYLEYYSCFISYSSRDEAFAKLLYSDLQAAYVRCWFAPEELKIGEIFRQTIHEAIRSHDKLLLVLSQNSVDSDWVQTEVESAFELERQERRNVLFPIRLDNEVMKTDKTWAGDIRRMRHIGDFSEWKNHDSYQKGFARLLRDLKAEDKPDKKES
jgi:uncharacterized protein YjbI with pentapeptide repeats